MDDLLEAFGFHPQSYGGTIKGTWLGKGRRAKVPWDTREPP